MEAIVLAGGLGTRLRSSVSSLPKCMAPVGSVPFLSYILSWLEEQGVDHVVLSVGYLREHIINWISTQKFSFEIDFAIEETPLGTGGGIREALKKCRTDKVFVVNGDTFYPVDLGAFPFNAPVTVALKPMRDFDRYGAVETRTGFPGCDRNDKEVVITRFREKASCKEGLINGGVYALSGLDLSGFPERFSFEKEVLEPLRVPVMGVVQDMYFLDIGIPEDYERAQTELPSYRAVKEASSKVLASGADTLLLDRDGTINVRIPGDYVRSWEQFVFLPGILEEFPKWAARFERIIVVTNQRGVGRALMTDASLAEIHASMTAAVQNDGGRIDAILTCTATSDSDPRRKPNPGMFHEALELFPGIRKAVMLGDSITDEGFARAAGIDFVKI